MPNAPTVIPWKLSGAAEELFWNVDPEVLLDGPAGTGKTFGICARLVRIAEKYPLCRILIVRKTRVSLTQSVLVTLEDEVLKTLNQFHPAIPKGGRDHRTEYRFPNGSVIVPAGMDQPTRILSTQWDIIWVNEGIELTEHEYEMLLSRLRNSKIVPKGWDHPLHQALVDTNPGRADHWLNARPERRVDDPGSPRFGKPIMTRLYSMHEDNPTITDDYMERLRNLTGVRRQRLYEGKWVSAEGLVWDTYNAGVHRIQAFVDGECVLPEMDYYFGSVDWGHRAPGVLQVWGSHDKAIYRVAEIYHARKDQNWWCDRVEQLHEEFNLVRIVCDSAEPDRIQMFNDRLGTPGGRTTPRIAVEANKSLLTGLEHVRGLLDPTQDQGPRIFFVEDALRYGPDPDRVEDMLPTCTEQEITAYSYPPTDKPGGRVDRKTEKPDPQSEDHGCDALRYACMWRWRREPLKPRPKRYKPGTAGEEFGHGELMGAA